MVSHWPRPDQFPLGETWFRLFAQGRESRLIAGVDGGGRTTTRGGSTTTGGGSTTGGATSATRATTTAAEVTTVTTTTTGATTSLGRLDIALVDVNDLLDLALTLTLGLAAGGGDEVLVLLLDELLGGVPLLVLLGALVGLADLQRVQAGTLLSLLSKVGIQSDLHLLRLLRLLGGSLSLGSLHLGLGDGLAGLLVLQLGVAFGGAPALSGLLLRVATAAIVRDYAV